MKNPLRKARGLEPSDVEILSAVRERMVDLGFPNPPILPDNDIKEIFRNIRAMVARGESVASAVKFLVGVTTLTTNGQPHIVFNM